MKLILEENQMLIQTESVQDVAYLKHMGYLSDDPEIHFKVSAHKWFDRPDGHSPIGSGPGAMIIIKWEDCKRGGESDPGTEFVQGFGVPRPDLAEGASNDAAR